MNSVGLEDGLEDVVPLERNRFHLESATKPNKSRTGREEQVRSLRHAQGNNIDDCDDSVVLKVGMVGDSQIGKTSLMAKYVEGSFDEDYIQTLGQCSHRPGMLYSF